MIRVLVPVDGSRNCQFAVRHVVRQFMSNTAGRNYGGLYAGNTTTVTMSSFQNNAAQSSGGMGVNGRLTMDSSRFVGNTVQNVRTEQQQGQDGFHVASPCAERGGTGER